MASIIPRGGIWRAVVRKKGYRTQTKSFPTKTLAKVWADRIEMKIATAEAGGSVDAGLTIAELVDWYQRDVSKLKRISKTQSGNLTRIREGLGSVRATKLTVPQIVEFVR